MTPRDFAFWLQGYFEIVGADTPLTARQAQSVLAKAVTVDAKSDDIGMFIMRARDSLDGMLNGPVLGAPSDSLLREVTDKLRAGLNDVFIHAIDPTIAGDQPQLRRTHRPGNKGGFEAMC